MIKRVMVAFALCIFGLSVLTFANAPDRSVADALATYSAAMQSIESYDVYVSVKHTENFKRVATGEQQTALGQNVPLFKFELFEPGEEQTDFYTHTRQLADASGKFRAETFDEDLDTPQGIQVFDGKQTRSLAVSANSGRLSNRDPKVRPYVDQEGHYAALFKDMFGGGSFVDLLRMRHNVRARMDKDEEEAVLIIETDAEKGKYYPRFGFKLTLSSKHGMLPKRIETFKGSRLYSDTQITAFRSLGENIWAPTAAVRRMYFPSDKSMVRTAHIKVDESKSRWNEPLEPELFTLQFPVDCKVFDENRKVVLVNGEEDAKYQEVCPAR